MPRHSTRASTFPPNLEDYAPWVAAHGLSAPYGQCQCGCGDAAPVAQKTERSDKVVKGKPKRFIPYHHWRTLDTAPAGYKTCRGCDKVLPLTNFCLTRTGKKGHAALCRDCFRDYWKKHVSANREHYAEWARNRNRTARGKILRKLNAKRYNKNNRDKYLARKAFRRALEGGKIKKQPCQVCGNTESQAHHEDYSKPLDVIWACFQCHRERFHGQTVLVRKEDS